MQINWFPLVQLEICPRTSFQLVLLVICEQSVINWCNGNMPTVSYQLVQMEICEQSRDYHHGT